MERVRYCDGCGDLVVGDPVHARRRRCAPDGRILLGPVRRFHPDCLDRMVDYVEVDDPHGWP